MTDVASAIKTAVNAGEFPWPNWQSNGSVAYGQVISQTSGNYWNGTYANGIEIAVSTGPATPAPATVACPNVVGLTIAAARAALAAANLTATGFTWVASSDPGGTVESQSPAAATAVLPGSAVALSLSLGAAP